MSLREMLLENWDFTMEKEDGYAPLSVALQDVTVEQALWKPGEGANSIWENVMHLLFYKEVLLARIEGRASDVRVSNDETFRIVDASEEAWREAQDRLKQVHAAVREKIQNVPEEELSEHPQRYWSFITHDAYHIGQIILLRKLQGSWPATRVF
ncbi:DinB family protein [Paenibacillus cisolokensis]|uniref:DinB family protein n=1 Tax=Paenibacillus cisolokensis TaxID=1658519 RepID=UPI003D296287